MHDVPFIECAVVLSKVIPIEDFEVFVIMCWAVWSEICKRTHVSMGYKYDINIDWVYALLEVFRLYNSVSVVVNRVTQPPSEQVWKPPSPNQFRLDVDAGFDDIGNRFSVGAVVRDSLGSVRGAKACIIRHPGSVKRAELTAIRFGMDLCLQLGIVGVCIFSDSNLAVQAVQNPSQDFGPNGVLASEIQALMDPAVFLSLNHMKRTANGVAHTLARKALLLSVNLEWLNGAIPVWLSNLVLKEL